MPESDSIVAWKNFLSPSDRVILQASAGKWVLQMTKQIQFRFSLWAPLFYVFAFWTFWKLDFSFFQKISDKSILATKFCSETGTFTEN